MRGRIKMGLFGPSKKELRYAQDVADLKNSPQYETIRELAGILAKKGYTTSELRFEQWEYGVAAAVTVYYDNGGEGKIFCADTRGVLSSFARCAYMADNCIFSIFVKGFCVYVTTGKRGKNIFVDAEKAPEWFKICGRYFKQYIEIEDSPHFAYCEISVPRHRINNPYFFEGELYEKKLPTPANAPVDTKATIVERELPFPPLTTTDETPKWTCKKCGHIDNYMTTVECRCGKKAEGKLLSVIRNWQSTQQKKEDFSNIEKFYFLCRTHGAKSECPQCGGEFANIGEKAYDGGDDFELIQCKECGFRLREVDHNVCSCPYCDKNCLVGMIVTTNPTLSRFTCKIENVVVCRRCTSLYEDRLSSCPECGDRPLVSQNTPVSSNTPKQNKWFCKVAGCGEPNAMSNTVCKSCGTSK